MADPNQPWLDDPQIEQPTQQTGAAPWEADALDAQPNAETHWFETRSPQGKTARFQAPASATDDEIKAASLKALGIDQPMNVDVHRDGTALPDNRPKSFAQGVVEGVEQPLNNFFRLADKGIRAVGGGDALDAVNQWSSQNFGTDPSLDAAEAHQRADNAASPTQGSGLGQFAGNVLATAPLAALPGGPLVAGAAGGALMSDDQSAGGLAKGAALGVGGTLAGGALFRGAAGLIAPRVAPALRTLIDAGVRATPGQIARASGTRAGNFLATMEDMSTSLPGAGPVVQGARRQAQNDFGRAAINRSLEPIGETLPQGLAGRDAIAHAGDRLSQAYNDVTPRLSATGDEAFQQDLQAIHQEAGNLVGPRQEQFNSILDGLGRFWQDGQHIDGQAFKEIETRLTKHVSDFGRSQDADQRQLGDLLQSVQESVRDLAARQNPEEAARIAQINRGWAGLAQVEKAAGNSRADISPAGYSQAVKQSSNTVRRRGYARGNALNQDLSDAGSSILPSGVPDSGTAGRAGLLGAGALGAGALAGSPAALGGIGALGAIGAAYTRLPQAAARWALTHNSGPQAEAIANLLRQGALAAPAVAPALVNQTGR